MIWCTMFKNVQQSIKKADPKIHHVVSIWSLHVGISVQRIALKYSLFNYKFLETMFMMNVLLNILFRLLL